MQLPRVRQRSGSPGHSLSTGSSDCRREHGQFDLIASSLSVLDNGSDAFYGIPPRAALRFERHRRFPSDGRPPESVRTDRTFLEVGRLPFSFTGSSSLGRSLPSGGGFHVDLWPPTTPRDLRVPSGFACAHAAVRHSGQIPPTVSLPSAISFSHREVAHAGFSRTDCFRLRLVMSLPGVRLDARRGPCSVLLGAVHRTPSIRHWLGTTGPPSPIPIPRPLRP